MIQIGVTYHLQQVSYCLIQLGSKVKFYKNSHRGCLRDIPMWLISLAQLNICFSQIFFKQKFYFPRVKMANRIEIEYGIIIVFVVAILAIWATKVASKSKEGMTAGLGTLNSLAWLNSGDGKTHCWPHDSYNPETGDYIGNSSGCAANSMLMGIGV